MNEWMNEWMSKRMSEWKNEWMDERMMTINWINIMVNEWLSVKNGWMNDWVNEWMSELSIKWLFIGKLNYVIKCLHKYW